ncbi:hypothetical protein IW262DRAFT_1292966 [Armillaria fumosa]|nr:hypothetical protein IW262DRAFT_1292966 [Armillaria fumosa]
MSTTMTTRSKKRGAQLTEMTVNQPDPQIILQPSSSEVINNQGTSAETATTYQEISGSSNDRIDAQATTTSVACGTSSLTPAESLYIGPSPDRKVLPTAANAPELPGAFSLTESRRRRVLDKAPAVASDWHSTIENTMNRDPLLVTVDKTTTTTNEGLIPILEEDISSDSEFDGTILANDQLAYDLAHDNNRPWTDPSEDEQATQLFLNKLSDHRCTVIQVLAHRQVGILFRHLGINEIDPESDIYQEQYNLMITMMVSGRIVMGDNNTHENETERASRSTLLDDQLQDVAVRIATNTRTDKVKPFKFQTPIEAVSESVPMKEESITLALDTPPSRPQAHRMSLNPRYGQTIKDKVILQQWRTHDLTDTGRTEIADQGIFIDDSSRAFIIKGGVADTNTRANRYLNNPYCLMDENRLALREADPIMVTIMGPPDGQVDYQYPLGDQDEVEVSHQIINIFQGAHQVVEDHHQEMGLIITLQRDLMMMTSIEVPRISGITLNEETPRGKSPQEAQSKFDCALFADGGGMAEGYQDLLQTLIRDMTRKPDDYTITQQFMTGLPSNMRDTVFEDRLNVEVNTLEEFVESAKAFEVTERSKKEYSHNLFHQSIIKDKSCHNEAKDQSGSPSRPLRGWMFIRNGGRIFRAGAPNVKCYRCSEMGHYASHHDKEDNPCMRAAHTVVGDDVHEDMDDDELTAENGPSDRDGDYEPATWQEVEFEEYEVGYESNDDDE